MRCCAVRTDNQWTNLKSNLFYVVLLQVKEKHITLPPLCSCPHELSPLNPQYVYACALNCPLYQNDALYNKLLQSLLYNYDL
jgi:hypothetical protein